MIRPILVVVALGIGVIASAAESPAENVRYSKLASDAARLTPEQVRKLEAAVKSKPEDVDARVQLLGYYFLMQNRQRDLRPIRQAHVLWMIEHHPVLALPGQLIG